MKFRTRGYTKTAKSTAAFKQHSGN